MRENINSVIFFPMADFSWEKHFNVAPAAESTHVDTSRPPGELLSANYSIIGDG